MNFLNLRWRSELSKLVIIPQCFLSPGIHVPPAVHAPPGVHISLAVHVPPGVHISPGVHVSLERKHWGIMTSLESSDLQRKFPKIMFFFFTF